MSGGLHKKWRTMAAALALSCLFASACQPARAEENTPSPAGRMEDMRKAASDLNFLTAERLLRAYPDAGMRLERDDSGLSLRLNGARLLFIPADGCPAPHPDAAEDQPLCASFSQPYPVGSGGRHPELGFDPGRVRNEALLKLLYGSDAKEVRHNCVSVTFMGHKLLFNARHGAAAALERVGGKLERLAQADPALEKYIFPLAGTLSWRSIEGTHRLSAHSFGLSIDLSVNKGPYWRWSKQNAPPVVDARTNYPQAIVDAFESEGFIWGGKWHSFDFMHFEYRPELFQDAP